jgi:hypothetical protein
VTWAKVDDRFNDDPKLLRLDRSVRLLHVEGITWSCRHLTNGFVPAFALAKVTDYRPPEDGIRPLVEAGLWEEAEDESGDTGWRSLTSSMSRRPPMTYEKHGRQGGSERSGHDFTRLSPTACVCLTAGSASPGRGRRSVKPVRRTTQMPTNVRTYVRPNVRPPLHSPPTRR